MRGVKAAAILILLVSGAAAQDNSSMMKANEIQVEFQQRVKLKYWLYLPPDYDQQDEWPLVVFLHGAGERGDDLEQLKVHGPPKLIAAGQSFPFVMVAPQCPRGFSWQGEPVAELTRRIASDLKIDRQRIYLTGLSMGGFGTWDAAVKFPDLYAAIMPICGGGDPERVGAISGLPTWVFHGAKDNAVPLARSEVMVDALKAAGGNVKFTVYPEAGHDSWTETYANPAVFQWLLEQRRSAP